MERIEIEVFSQTTNAAVVRMPTRRFPGMVIQGDSLHILYRLADSIAKTAASSANAEFGSDAEQLKDFLARYVSSYEDVLKSHGMELPYAGDRL